MSRVFWFVSTSVITCSLAANAFFVRSLVDKLDAHSSMIEQTNITVAGLMVKVDDLREFLKKGD